MSRLKLLFLSVMAVFAIGAVAASVASAAATHWVIEGAELKAGESETVLGLISGPATLHALIGSVGFELSCTAAHASGTIKGTNKGEAPNGVPFAGCTILHPTGCKVREPISTVPESGVLLEEVGEQDGYVTWTPTKGEVFVTITMTGSACSVEGDYEVKGRAQCEGKAIEAVDTSCLFNSSSKSELTIGKNQADFLAHFLLLLTGKNAGKKWGAAE